MLKVVISLLLGVMVGVAVGLYLGWVQFPVEYVNSPANALAQQYKDEYTVMVAGGYLGDNDARGAVERLKVLRIENVPDYVREVAERYIFNSSDVTDIRYLVALSEGLGRTSEVFAPYRLVAGQP